MGGVETNRLEGPTWRFHRHTEGMEGPQTNRRNGVYRRTEEIGVLETKGIGGLETEKQTGGKLGGWALDCQTERGGGIDLSPMRGRLLGQTYTQTEGRS